MLNSFKKIGQVNPLICVEDGDKYKVCVGNNRFLAGCELGFKEFDIIVVPVSYTHLTLPTNREV